MLYENRRRLTKLAVHHHGGTSGCPAIATSSILIIGSLIVAVGVLGYNLYQTKKEPEGVQINVGPGGLKIQSK